MNRAEVIQELTIRKRLADGEPIPVSEEAIESIITLLKEQRKVGKWVEPEDHHDYVTPGGTPYYVCSLCGESGHLHGVEYPRRKLICDNCGAVNSYPWETTYDDDACFT